ncbi:MAG: CHASE2 domain-containing protein [Mariprofundaceae bacterium]|nr:CHASE2 domain-containing protein [Mariprofundaceae bacterium]
MNNSAFWKSDWVLGLGITLLFCLAYLTGFGPTLYLEQKAYDLGVSASITSADNRIVILDIDNSSIERIGRWPWPRSVVADVIRKLSDADARLIGVDIFYSEKQQAPRSAQTHLQLANILRQQGKIEEADKIIAEALEMDEDLQLINATRNSGIVFMPMFFDAGVPYGRPDAELPDYVSRMVVKNIGEEIEGASPLNAVKLHYPFPELAKAVAGMGYLNVTTDSDGVLRTEPLVVNYYGDYLPSMSLAIAAKELNLTMSDIRINIGRNVELGHLDIGTNANMYLYPAFYGDGTGSSFKHYSFHDLSSGRVPARVFKDKIVLIGVTATGIGETHVTPIDNQMSGVEYHAHVIQSILNEEFFTRPPEAVMIELLLLFAVGLYLSVLLLRLSAMAGAIVSLLILATLFGTSFMLLLTSAVWIQTVTASLLLLFGHMMLTTKHHFASEDAREKLSSDSAETNKMLGLSFQSQGMLDMAFDKFRKCPLNDDILSVLYNLALDFERKRQFNKATAVYEHMAEHNSNYKDIQVRMERVKNAGETAIFGGTAGNAMSTLLITGGAKPTLGRYEIIKELGKGAMGTVYLGKDPKINREVAIKTMALSQEFEPDELEEVKERFFREAETAGMLNHPNIVTIYDAGDEHDLAYIAMEFLSGSDLAPYTKKGKLFPVGATMKICGKVAEALHYAHSQNVVHRDIKPANIMLLKDKTVKVTDFGIARITASSKTKTGVVLGTPSYMSPEQLSGKHVDGRSDIFSLGVMLYEMLTGVRPFRGDSMATLMFQIANEPHPDIREHRKELPESIAKLIDLMLAKDSATRIANGNQVVRGIIGCLKDVKTMGDSR